MVGSAGPTLAPGIGGLAGIGLPPNPIAFGGKSVLNFSFVVNPDFTMTPQAPTSATLNAGSSTTYTVAIGSNGGFLFRVPLPRSLPPPPPALAPQRPPLAPGT